LNYLSSSSFDKARLGNSFFLRTYRKYAIVLVLIVAASALGRQTTAAIVTKWY
jgi:hypothetical protein